MTKLKKSPRALDRGTKSTRGRPRKVPIQIEEEDRTPAARNGENVEYESEHQLMLPIEVPPISNSKSSSSQTLAATMTKARTLGWADVVGADSNMAKSINKNIKVR